MTIEFVYTLSEGGNLKRSLGMVSLMFTIPKAFGFEAATQRQRVNLQIRK